MHWLKKHLKALIIITAILIAYFSQVTMSDWLVKKKIRKDITAFSQLYTSLYRQSFEQMRELSEQLMFICDRSDIELMSQAKMRNIFVDYVDLHLENSQSCSIYNNNRADRKLMMFPESEQLNFDNMSIILSKNQFKEMHFNRNGGILRFAFQQPRNFLTNCDHCLFIIVDVNGRNIQLYSQTNEPYKEIYNGTLNNGIGAKLYINERGVEFLVGNLVKFFAILVVLLGVLLAVGIELNQPDYKGLNSLLNDAIESNVLIPFYQPIVMPEGGKYKVVGAEVLVRWLAENGEYIPPSSFIPIAEQNGTIDRITDQLIDNVLADIQMLNLPENFFMSVNVSPSYLEKTDTADKLLNKIAAVGLDPHVLSLEITERTKFSDLHKAAACIETLTAKGISIKLDDCGTGYGAFSYLHILNIDTIKIDRMFITSIGLADFKNNILGAILAFARESNLHVVAEGIETKVQADYLIKNGVEMLQGSYFADPVPFESFKFKQITTNKDSIF
ncbi:EAL domain-containing protein [Candidatus Enterovibrio altilux]|uniref:Diguanylate cyclase/phosphodiesterase (GGDEF & EAL domains) with PAS/PAC sensor(S) n=2 Tax=Candidatus Enterovibrio altilux TaxID=1927128 RepID=A0A291BAY8_9GAMM|nr:EAL domain-containing protein [Candidatus Enterovibrio luxaltus]ATF10135.1 diguanylate cyclase/phosphodiesterase (GGDEF & EAL domains) with PAS/PAC sensor(s) [Candidatus Enterovibrio luxaltus]